MEPKDKYHQHIYRACELFAKTTVSNDLL